MSRAPRRIRPAAILAALAIGGALGLGIFVARSGWLDAWISTPGPASLPPPPPPYEALGRTVDVEGRAVYLDCRGSGSPTVILEAGISGNTGLWGWLLPDAAGVTRVCAWDRPGLGRSDSRGLHSGLEAVTDLRRALEAAGEHGPYVVVAASLGGVYAVLFDALQASSVDEGAGDEGVAALLLLDTTEPLVWMADDALLDEAIRMNHRDVLAQTGQMIQDAEELDWDATLAELRALPPTEVEVLLLVVTMDAKFGDQSQPAPAALAASWYRVVGEQYLNGRVEVVPDSGHVIHSDRPELVADRLRTVVEAIRSR
jgi:pimeloyl-ACP methyl ester carboxylesterase